MTFEELRIRHPRFVYRSFDIETGDDELIITQHYMLEPDIRFDPVTRIPLPKNPHVDLLDAYVFNLGLIESISYWKTACPRELVVEAGMLTDGQIRFWYDLVIHGLGEFFYRNAIDFTADDFLRITAADGQAARVRREFPDVSRTDPFDAPPSDLVMVGGGKDTAVTLGVLTGAGKPFGGMVVNPTKAALDTMLASGVKRPIIVERMMDPKLFTLNQSGYLNGHTPFSAYLAFLGTFVGALYGFERVLVSNERSANEGNVVYRGMEINHQYSKSFRFESMFRGYVTDHLPGAPEYSSFLRPLNDLQIGELFAAYPKFFPTFRSCNAGSKSNAWCGRCPKCAFTYLTLYPFLTKEQMMDIFGHDYFQSEPILSYIRELTGLLPVKPFECVGTRDEAKLAVVLSVKKYESENREIPEGLLKIKSDLNLSDAAVADLSESVLRRWGDTYNVPEEHLTILRNAWSQVSHTI